MFSVARQRSAFYALIQVGLNASSNGNSKDNIIEALHSSEMLELAGLPPPPSADTTNLRGRSTTLRGEELCDDNPKIQDRDCSLEHGHVSTNKTTNDALLRAPRPHKGGRQNGPRGSSASSSGGSGANLMIGDDRSGTSTPERIRFKAFPYSGINDYMIFCETGFLSVGGG